jgi:alkanesulfonate monooxygenase SsuD/methylene tetrahydromethanopterin reductase-like flavin-dependent oxidoreductase (luciferase family)
MHGEVSIGVPGALGPEAVGRLAPHVERHGFASLWVNDTPGGDALAALAAAAAVTTHLRLAAGVIPVDRRPAADILEAVRSTGLPEARLTIGIGSGAARAGALARVREAAATLHEHGGAAVVVGALGPRMRALGAESADGVLLNWVTPGEAAEQARRIRAARVPAPRVLVYARTIVDPAARPALEAEAARYGSIGAYAENFERMGVRPIETTLPLADDDLAAGVRSYLAGVDELVLRAVTPTGSVDDLLRFIESAAEQVHRGTT